MTFVLLLCAALTFLALWYMMHPLFLRNEDGTMANQNLTLQGLLDQRERCVQVLRDLELDRETQKIQESDFQHMFAQVQKELALLDERVKSVRGA